MNEEWEPWLVQDKDKRECWRRKASGHVHGLKDQSKYKTKKPKKQNFEETFWFSLKKCFFFYFHFVFFGFEMQKQKKHCVFCFFEGLWLEKITKNQKNTKHTQNPKSKNQNFEETFWFSLKTCFFGFHFVFFRLWNAKAEKTLCFFCFFEGLWLEKITKNQKNTKQTQNQKPKNQNFEETFWFSLKKCFFLIFILFFLALKCKSRKNIVFFCFLKVYGWRKSPNTKKTSSFFAFQNPKKTRKTKNIFCD